MRIAFTGSHGVGKTTLAEKIADHLPGYDLQNEPYFQLEEKGYLFSEIPTVDDYVEQFNFSIQQIENSENDVLFDRCPLDLLAYIYAENQATEMPKRHHEMMTAMSKIDLLVFIPIETPDVIICANPHLPDLRSSVNDILQNWIEDVSTEMIEVSGTLEHRKEQVLTKIYKLTE